MAFTRAQQRGIARGRRARAGIQRRKAKFVKKIKRAMGKARKQWASGKPRKAKSTVRKIHSALKRRGISWR